MQEPKKSSLSFSIIFISVTVIYFITNYIDVADPLASVFSNDIIVENLNEDDNGDFERTIELSNPHEIFNDLKNHSSNEQQVLSIFLSHQSKVSPAKSRHFAP